MASRNDSINILSLVFMEITESQELLSLILTFIGKGHHRFIAGISKQFKKAYQRMYGFDTLPASAGEGLKRLEMIFAEDKQFFKYGLSFIHNEIDVGPAMNRNDFRLNVVDDPMQCCIPCMALILGLQDVLAYFLKKHKFPEKHLRYRMLQCLLKTAISTGKIEFLRENEEIFKDEDVFDERFSSKCFVQAAYLKNKEALLFLASLNVSIMYYSYIDLAKFNDLEALEMLKAVDPNQASEDWNSMKWEFEGPEIVSLASLEVIRWMLYEGNCGVFALEYASRRELGRPEIQQLLIEFRMSGRS